MIDCLLNWMINEMKFVLYCESDIKFIKELYY